MDGKLVLANGLSFNGKLLGACQPAMGEVVFTTGMTGYWETLTDPSYAGQLITMTYPLQGNYGVNPEKAESDHVWCKGMIVREMCDYPNHFLMQGTLEQFLIEHHITVISEVDTRALVRLLRNYGVMDGIIVPATVSQQDALAMLKGMEHPDYVKQVACSKMHSIKGSGTKVALIDFGTKNNIIRKLQALDCSITIFPPDCTASEVMAVHPDGVLLGNGPGAPEVQVSAISLVRDLAGRVPIVGICLGHQIIALAMGAATYKLPFGHRGGNHPVKDLATGQVRMTSQNHGYAVDLSSIQHTQLEVTHLQLNDNTIEGLRHKTLPIWSIQYHPEGSPGPLDSSSHFGSFIKTFQRKKGR